MENEVLEQNQTDDNLTTADLVNRNRQSSEPTPQVSNGSSGHDPLFAPDETEHFRSRWSDVQSSFVDEPQQAVEKADQLVASAIKRLAEVFANERDKLERDWSKGGDVSTEDLRQALRRYRSFFDRLLSV